MIDVVEGIIPHTRIDTIMGDIYWEADGPEPDPNPNPDDISMDDSEISGESIRG